MNHVLSVFFERSLYFRVILLLFIFFLLWGLIGRFILLFLSFFPYLLKTIILALYLIFESIEALLHKRIGSNFYAISNKISRYGEKLYSVIDKWYKLWRYPQSIHMKKAFFIYAMIVISIIFAPIFKIQNSTLNFPKTLYIKFESSLVNWLKNKQIFDENIYAEEQIDNTDPIETIDYLPIDTQDMENGNSFAEKIIVFGINTSLLVRDMPNMNGNILDRLYNGDEAIWTGFLSFSKVNGKVEAWIKVITPNEIEGWSRLSYIYPKEYENKEYKIIQSNQ